MEQLSGTPHKSALAAGLAIIEKVQEVRWTLQALSAALFADLVLVAHTGTGLSAWSAKADQLLVNAGFLIVGVLGFAVTMSIGLPVLGAVLRPVVVELVYRLPSVVSMRSNEDYRRPVGWVTPFEFHDHALEKGDKLLLDMYAAHQQKVTERESGQAAMGQIAFAVLVLGTLNFFAQHVGIDGLTITRGMLVSFGRAGEFALAMALLFIVAVIKAFWFPTYRTDWIYYPPLYKEIMRAQEQTFSVRPHHYTD